MDLSGVTRHTPATVADAERQAAVVAPVLERDGTPHLLFTKRADHLGEHPGQILISHEDYKARTEWVRLLKPTNDRISFENKKRPIGAKYDPLIAIGVDELEAVDDLAEAYKNKELGTIIREVVHELSNLSPQGTAHAVTVYSAVNVVRRCPPGPIFALLTNRSDFVDVGHHYWQISTGDDAPNA